jgi:hypothetical protein
MLLTTRNINGAPDTGFIVIFPTLNPSRQIFDGLLLLDPTWSAIVLSSSGDYTQTRRADRGKNRLTAGQLAWSQRE